MKNLKLYLNIIFFKKACVSFYIKSKVCIILKLRRDQCIFFNYIIEFFNLVY